MGPNKVPLILSNFHTFQSHDVKTKTSNMFVITEVCFQSVIANCHDDERNCATKSQGSYYEAEKQE